MKTLLLKVSGEFFSGANNEPIFEEKVKEFAMKIKEIHDMGYNVAIVTGGGNLFRGRDLPNMESVKGDSMGMLGTVLNAIVISNSLEELNIPYKTVTPFDLKGVSAVNMTDDDARKECHEGIVIVYGGGTGYPGCTTDTAAGKKAVAINADVLIKITSVGKIYDKDPKKYSDAKPITKLTIDEAINNSNINIMDQACMEDCRNNNIEIWICSFNDLIKAIKGEIAPGTKVIIN